jgi:hypothetical protein
VADRRNARGSGRLHRARSRRCCGDRDWLGPWATLIALVLAGSVEGAVLGAAQADCLYRWAVLPVRRRWIVATSIGAMVAWSLGMLPSTLGGLDWSAGTAVMVGIGGLILHSCLPAAQYFVLRDHVKRPGIWIPINWAAWLAPGNSLDARALAVC